MIPQKISVVCPTWNSEKYIERALMSIARQKDKPEEVICVDDGSTDKTAAILRRWTRQFKDKGIDFLVLERSHDGPSMSRNIGIKHASHPWIAFLDSDDYWEPDKIKDVKETIYRNADANIILHWEKYERSTGTNRILKHGQKYRKEESLPKQLYRNNFFSTSAIVCRRELLIQNGSFDVTLPNAQDYDLWLRMSDSLRLSIIPKVLGSYIEQKSSISSRPYYIRYSSLCRVACRHWKKGGRVYFFLKLFRLTFSEQWVTTVINLCSENKRHSI